MLKHVFHVNVCSR